MLLRVARSRLFLIGTIGLLTASYAVPSYVSASPPPDSPLKIDIHDQTLKNAAIIGGAAVTGIVLAPFIAPAFLSLVGFTGSGIAAGTQIRIVFSEVVFYRTPSS